MSKKITQEDILNLSNDEKMELFITPEKICEENACSQEELDQGVAGQMLELLESNSGQRMSEFNLLQMVSEAANAAFLRKNRCMIVSAICNLMHMHGLPDENIKTFFHKQIKKKRDCAICQTKCSEDSELNPNLVFMHEGSEKFN